MRTRGALVWSIAGYYRNEFRTQSHVTLHVRQEFWFAKDRMMWVWLDGGQVQLQALDDFQEAAGTRQNLFAIAVGFPTASAVCTGFRFSSIRGMA